MILDQKQIKICIDCKSEFQTADATRVVCKECGSREYVDRSEAMIRTCLKCGKEFQSRSKGNRRCKRCSGSDMIIPSPVMLYKPFGKDME